MALNIKSERADRLARELAVLTGESITDVVIESLEQRLRVQRARRHRSIDDLIERFAALAELDSRTADEILGYDDHGLPG